MKAILDGWRFAIKDLTREEIHGFINMIDSAKLPEKRTFYDLKNRLKELLIIKKS